MALLHRRLSRDTEMSKEVRLWFMSSPQAPGNASKAAAAICATRLRSAPSYASSMIRNGLHGIRHIRCRSRESPRNGKRPNCSASMKTSQHDAKPDEVDHWTPSSHWCADCWSWVVDCEHLVDPLP